MHTHQKAIDNFADASGNRFTLVMFKRKGMLHALVSMHVCMYIDVHVCMCMFKRKGMLRALVSFVALASLPCVCTVYALSMHCACTVHALCCTVYALHYR